LSAPRARYAAHAPPHGDGGACEEEDGGAAEESAGDDAELARRTAITRSANTGGRQAQSKQRCR
jgi:hypothetical protein